MALINLENIPNNMISGMSTEMLEWASSDSSERGLYELSCDFVKMLENEEVEVLHDISSDIDAELTSLQNEAIPKSTQYHMEKYFKSYPFVYLRYYYSQLRKQDGTFYAPASLVCIRAGLYRYFTTQLIRKDINVISDCEFRGSNDMLKAMVYKFKRSNQPQSECKYPAIEMNDIVSIRTYFDRSNPLVLQQEVAFNLMYYFNLRGRETLPYLNSTSISICVDSNDKKYLRMNTDTVSKNAKASLSAKEYEHAKAVRVYENTDESECPVKAFEIYLAKLQESQIVRLFPKPLKNGVKTWYSPNSVIGKNKIDSLMSYLSAKLHLTKRYTNHCIRVTGITVCKEQGKTNEEIAAISGHKNANSIQRYVRKRRDESFYDQSTSLQMGFSKVKHTILPVGTGKIIVKEDMRTANSVQISQQGNECKFSLSFSGTFNNCKFLFNDENENV